MTDRVIKLILDSKPYIIPYDKCHKAKKEIYEKLIFDHEYTVKSNVNEEIFKMFIQYWIEDIKPDINVDNFRQFYQLSQEFELMKDLIEAAENEFGQEFQCLNQLIESSEENKPIYEKQISHNLDDYLETHGNEIMKLPIQTLYNIFCHPELNLSKHNLAYQLILNRGRENKAIYSLLKFVDGSQLSKENIEDSICNQR